MGGVKEREEYGPDKYGGEKLLIQVVFTVGENLYSRNAILTY